MFIIAVISAFSLWVPGILSALKFKESPVFFKPFLLLMIVGSLNELLSFLLLLNGYASTANNNVYVLIESVLLVQFFYWSGMAFTRKALYYSLLAVLSATWLLDNFLYGSIYQLGLWFRIIYSAIVIVLGNTVLVKSVLRRRLMPMEIVDLPFWKNPYLLACAALVLYFTYKLPVEIRWLFGDPGINIFMIIVILNGIVNLIFGVVVWLLPVTKMGAGKVISIKTASLPGKVIHLPAPWLFKKQRKAGKNYRARHTT